MDFSGNGTECDRTVDGEESADGERRREKRGKAEGRKEMGGKTNRTEYNGDRCDGSKGKCTFG